MPDKPSNNAASNGFWLHDDGGPRTYVPPPGAETAADAEAASLQRKLAAVPGAGHLSVARTKDGLRLSGVVGGTETYRSVLHLAAENGADAAGVTIAPANDP